MAETIREDLAQHGTAFGPGLQIIQGKCTFCAGISFASTRLGSHVRFPPLRAPPGKLDLDVAPEARHFVGGYGQSVVWIFRQMAHFNAPERSFELGIGHPTGPFPVREIEDSQRPGLGRGLGGNVASATELFKGQPRLVP